MIESPKLKWGIFYLIIFISLSVSITTLAPQLNNGFSSPLPQYFILLGPSISTSLQYVFFLPSLIVMTGRSVSFVLLDLMWC
jgi:hypothetical protein